MTDDKNGFTQKDVKLLLIPSVADDPPKLDAPEELKGAGSVGLSEISRNRTKHLSQTRKLTHDRLKRRYFRGSKYHCHHANNLRVGLLQ